MGRNSKNVTTQGLGKCLEWFPEADFAWVLAFYDDAESLAIGLMGRAELFEDGFAAEFFDFGIEGVAGDAGEFCVGLSPIGFVGEMGELETQGEDDGVDGTGLVSKGNREFGPPYEPIVERTPGLVFGQVSVAGALWVGRGLGFLAEGLMEPAVIAFQRGQPGGNERRQRGLRLGYGEEALS